MKFLSRVALPIFLLMSQASYAVHAEVIRYNNNCLTQEHRGNPDSVDAVIFGRKPLINFEHVLATPHSYVIASKEAIETMRVHVLDAMKNKLTDLENQLINSYEDGLQETLRAAHMRLTTHIAYLEHEQYEVSQSGDLIAVPEQDVVLLMQWAERIEVGGDEILPVITVVLDDATCVTVGNGCGDLPFVFKDHIYWQKLIEAGWVAVDADVLGRVQPVLHTSVIGEKFHFYKTRYGVYFRETLGEYEPIPGDLVRIVKYIDADPRINKTVHGNEPVIWLKFPADKNFKESQDGQYIPYTDCAQTASWVYIHDLQALFSELQNQ